jgi:hypothetical protein
MRDHFGYAVFRDAFDPVVPPEENNLFVQVTLIGCVYEQNWAGEKRVRTVGGTLSWLNQEHDSPLWTFKRLHARVYNHFWESIQAEARRDHQR